MGTAERRRREAEHRRQSILAAARRVFWQQGYSGATMPQIAAEAELAPGTLYLYFPGKDALYVELLVEGYDLLLGRLEKTAKQEGAPSEVGSSLIDTFFGFARDFPEYFDIMFFVLQREQGGWEANFPAEQVERLEAREAACRRVVAAMLDRIGYGTPEAREAVMSAVWSMLAGVVFYWRNREGFDAVAGEAKTLLLRAVFGGK